VIARRVRAWVELSEQAIAGRLHRATRRAFRLELPRELDRVARDVAGLAREVREAAFLEAVAELDQRARARRGRRRSCGLAPLV